jgi:putative membrane protein
MWNVKSFFLSVVINAVALWLTTILLPAQVSIYPPGMALVPFALTVLWVAVVFGLVNGTLGTVLRFLSFPLFILTLGLFALVLNALLLMFIAWISTLIGAGLTVNGFGGAFWGSIVLSLVSWILGLILRPRA